MLLWFAALGPTAAQDTSLQELDKFSDAVSRLLQERRYREAIPLAQRELATQEKVHGAEHPDTALVRGLLASIYKFTGDFAQAESLYETALAIQEKLHGTEHANTATALSDLAASYSLTGAYVRAESLVKRALAIQEKLLGTEHPETAKSLNTLARIYRFTGAYTEAELIHTRGLAIQEKLYGAEDWRTAVSLNDLAELNLLLGAYDQAEPRLKHALSLMERAVGAQPLMTAAITAAVAKVLDNLGKLYFLTGDYALAERVYARALATSEKVFGPEHPNTAATLSNLSLVHYATGSSPQAESLAKRALAVLERAYGRKPSEIANALNSLALIYFQTGAYDQAEALLKRGLTIHETTSSLNNLALIHFAARAYVKAEPLFMRALAIQEEMLGDGHPQNAVVLAGLGWLYQSTGARSKAVQYLGRAQRVREANTARFVLAASEGRRLSYMLAQAGYVSSDISLSLKSTIRGARSLGLSAVLQFKGRVLDATSGNTSRLRRSIAPQDLALFDQLAALVRLRSNLSFGEVKGMPPEARRERLNSLAFEQGRIEADLSSRSAEFRQETTPVALDRVRDALPEDALLVEWFRFEPYDPKGMNERSHFGAPRYAAYVLSRKGDPAAIDLGVADEIDGLVAGFRKALHDPRSTFFKDAAQDVYAKIIKPLRPYLGTGGRLLLSPDAELNLVPFAALVNEQGEYLGQRHEITYLTSGRDLLRLAVPAPRARAGAVVVANPAFGRSGATRVAEASIAPTRSADLDRSGLEFSALPGTAAEAEALGRLFKLGPQSLLTGERATETALKQLKGPRILHIATHGFFLNDREAVALSTRPLGITPDAPAPPLGENPLLRSGLALAGANARRSGADDDGILTAAEVAQMDLQGTQLVVLSACETGVGQVQSGEGVYGLRRALVLAGAQSQLVSLWKVDDAATQKMMVDYYQRLLNGEGRSAALRSAQQAMQANPAYQHPYYWAAFVPIGNWAPLSKE